MAKIIAIKAPNGYRDCARSVLYFKCVGEVGEEICTPESMDPILCNIDKDYPGFWVDSALYELCKENGIPRRGIQKPDAYFAILTSSLANPEPNIKDFPLQDFLDRVNTLLA